MLSKPSSCFLFNVGTVLFPSEAIVRVVWPRGKREGKKAEVRYQRREGSDCKGKFDSMSRQFDKPINLRVSTKANGSSSELSGRVQAGWETIETTFKKKLRSEVALIRLL